MKKEILKQLKSDYERLEIRPSVDLWDRIEERRAEKEKTTILSVQNHFQWLKYAAIILLLLSVGTILYFNGDLRKKEADPIVKTDPVEKAINPDQDRQTVQANPIADTSSQRRQDQPQTGPIQKYTGTEDHHTEGSMPVQKEMLSFKYDEVKTPVVEQAVVVNTEIKEVGAPKKANYINADELLQGHEFDKTRQESHNGHKKFGVLDMNKIKLKSPNSLKIFGMTVFSDSLETN